MSPRAMGYILIISAAVTMVGGLLAFIFNQSNMNRLTQNILMVDAGFLGLFVS